MDTIRKDDQGCVWYMNKILIYGRETEVEHQAYLDKILQQCVDHVFAVDLTKSWFHVHQNIFPRHIINGSQVQMDAAKLQTMSNWPVLTNEKELQAFLGFANYYRRFIVHYAGKAHPCIDLNQDVPFSCGHQPQQAYKKL